MRGRPTWQPAQPGMMFYVPADHTSVHDTQNASSQFSAMEIQGSSAQSQASIVTDTILPSCEIGSDVYVKSEPVEEMDLSTLRDDSPGTIVDDTYDEVLSDAPSVSIPTLKSTESDYLFQLMAAAENNSLEATGTSSDDVETSSGNLMDTGYDSDRTDFQETTPSPSLRRSQHARRLATGIQSQHIREFARPLTRQPVARLLNFTGDIHRRAAISPNKRRGALERTPPHNYTSDERELLCILNRFYHSDDVLAIPKVFNAIAGLELRHRTIKNYFENHMCLFGPESFRVFSRTLSVPFDNPQAHYADILATIDQTANNLNLNLRRRSVDPEFVSGKATKSTSPHIRKNYTTLVEKAQQEERDETANALIVEEVAAAMQSLGVMSRALKFPFQDNEEFITDAEQSPKCMLNSIKPPKISSSKPHLTFRVWDSANRTKFIDGNFVAQTFVDWPRPFPAPIPLKDSSNAGKILTVLHLSKEGDTPVYISTTSSLLQALSYATSMQQPQLALINLDASSLQEAHKLHHAADVFVWLKAQGLARWARYKGRGEYFVWSDIPSSAVIFSTDLTDLFDRLKKDIDCQSPLNFDIFEPGTKTNVIAAGLREKNLMLNTASARAMGKIAKAFGMAQSNVSLQHLREFVARVMDGWTILKADSIDVHTLSSLASTFATVLGSHHAGYTVQDVMGAFIDGVDDGTRCIEYWSKSRSGSRRQRFRAA